MSTFAPRRSWRPPALVTSADLRRLARRFRAPEGAPPPPPAVTAGVVAGLVVSALAAWIVLYALVFSGLQANRTNSVLYATLRENLSAATTPIGGVINPGTPIALLSVPGAGLPAEVLVEGTSPSDLRSGPGHLRTTPLPGQAGVSVIYGRSTTFGAPFAHLPGLKRGARITVTTGQGTFVYAVDGIRRPGDPTPSLLPPGSSRLLLETAAGPMFGARRTVFVDATIVDPHTVVAAPSGRPTSVPSEELAMHGQPSALLPLVLWLQGLVIAALGIVWARARWGVWQSWLLGTPIAIAMLWGASSTAMLLVPNLV